MSEKRRFLDVWIIEANTVYREVPFDVVADWIQQGRLLEDDKVRPSGTAEWFTIGAVPGFAAYLPKPRTATAACPTPTPSSSAWKNASAGGRSGTSPSTPTPKSSPGSWTGCSSRWRPARILRKIPRKCTPG